MTKQETQIMKGVAILLMIFLHLFNQMSNVELCRSFIYLLYIGCRLLQILLRFF
jgi:hypothetical protein